MAVPTGQAVSAERWHGQVSSRPMWLRLLSRAPRSKLGSMPRMQIGPRGMALVQVFAAGALAMSKRPELWVHAGNLPASVEAARELLAKKAMRWFDRGVPVRIIE